MDLPEFPLGNVPQVAIHGVGLGGTGFHIDPVLPAIFNHLLAARESLAEVGVAPGCEDF